MILVTGANGMIGSHLTKALLDKGYRVIGLDRTEQRLSCQGYTHIQGDLSDKAGMVDWVATEPDGKIRVIKDEKKLITAEMIILEKAAGRAKHVLHFPRWLVTAGYGVARITGKNKYTYLLNKAVHPLRSE